jgi:hypothetical protein
MGVGLFAAPPTKPVMRAVPRTMCQVSSFMAMRTRM